MIVINNLNVIDVDYDEDYVYIQTVKTTIQISRVVISRINVLLPENEEESA